jgi:primosomal protein N' (replication factor Y)
MPDRAEQKSLFLNESAPWEDDDAADRLCAEVVFDRPVDTVFYYTVPDRFRDELSAGKQVLAPFGRGDRPTRGFCVGVTPWDSVPDRVRSRDLKTLGAVLDDEPLFGPTMLDLTRWMADYYLCSWGQVLEAVLPAGVKRKAGTRTLNLVKVPERVRRDGALPTLPRKQAQVFQFLWESREPVSVEALCRAARCGQSPIQALKRRGLVETVRRRIEGFEPRVPREAISPALKLNRDQQTALDAILGALSCERHQTFVLLGVTGSGKTEVYIQAIEQVVRDGRQAIVLVPEISLTPQTISRFRERFTRVAVLHSHLSDSERRWHWRRIAAGEVEVVVGARSAVFAPTPRLGLLVIDEEHETSFKQETVPRYHAREVALQRARREAIPLVLGSATPSLESWHQAQEGPFTLLSLPTRIFGRPLPAVRLIDQRHEAPRRGLHALSLLLEHSIRHTLEQQGQVILLLNRRGFSTHIQCPRCGHVVQCPHCDIALVDHRKQHLAVCHYCDYSAPPPDHCPACAFAGMRYQGIGSQRLEEEVKAKFTGYRCLRMDSDTMRAPGSHERALSAFRCGDVRILLGTQMIAKGLDFPEVTLVGVVNADLALHLPDFRAAERAFQLVAQVAGRTGRSERGGRVLVQTFNPEHPAIAAAAEHGYRRFVDGELPHREALAYPPFGRMARLVVRSQVEDEAAQFARQLGDRLVAAAEEAKLSVRVLGPAPAPITKLRGYFRFHLQLHTSATDATDRADSPIHRLLRSVLADLRPAGGVEFAVDIDPLNML